MVRGVVQSVAHEDRHTPLFLQVPCDLCRGGPVVVAEGEAPNPGERVLEGGQGRHQPSRGTYPSTTSLLSKGESVAHNNQIFFHLCLCNKKLPTVGIFRAPFEHKSILRMPVCAVCSSPALSQCSRCKSVSYCSPAHQREDWAAHKVQCPRLALEALATVFHPCDEELLLRITTCLAQNDYHKEVGVMVQLNKAFWNDEQIWDAFKDVPGLKGQTRLMHASMWGRMSRLKQLLARGARVNTVLFKDGTTALMIASICGHLEGVRELCRKGADVNAVNFLDGTALTLASERGHLEVVRELCALGAYVNYARASCGYTSLNIASLNGHLEVVRVLCNKGANVNSKSNDGSTANRTNNGATSLLSASIGGHLGIVRELCARGAKVNFARASDGLTSLMIACQNGHLEIVRELCNKGANVNAAQTGNCFTALMWACQKGHLEIARELCARGVNVNAVRTDNGIAALHIASYAGHLELTRLLLQKGADKFATSSGASVVTAFSVATGPHKAALEALLKP